MVDVRVQQQGVFGGQSVSSSTAHCTGAKEFNPGYCISLCCTVIG
jgi:hypothetical protein